MHGGHKHSRVAGSHRFDVRHFSSLTKLSLNRLIGFVAIGLLGLYFPIFLYELLGGNLWWLMGLYFISFLFRVLLFPVAGKVIGKIGLVASMIIGLIAWIAEFVFLWLLELSGVPNALLLGAVILTVGIYVAMYWAPYHVEYAEVSKKGKRGKEVSGLYAAQQVIGIVMPLVAAWLISTIGYSALFVGSLIVAAVSIIPLFGLKNEKVVYEFGYLETFKKAFEGDFKYLTFAMMASGAESFVAVTIWPIFLFTVFEGRYLDVGIFASVIVMIGIVLQLLIGRALDGKDRKGLLRKSVDLYSLGWFVKAFVDSVAGVFGAATFHAFGGILMRTSVDVVMYEKAADSGHYIDEYSVIREIGLHIGRCLMILAVGVLLIWLPLSSAFVLAAVVSLGMSLLSKYHLKFDG